MLCQRLMLGSAPHFMLSAGRDASPEEVKFVKECLCQSNIGDIFPVDSLRRKMMDSMQTVKASISVRRKITGATPCSGVYYYKLYSFWPNPKWRDPEYIRGFCLLEHKLLAFSPTDTAANRRLLRKLRPKLIKTMGAEKVSAEERRIIAGGIYIN